MGNGAERIAEIERLAKQAGEGDWIIIYSTDDPADRTRNQWEIRERDTDPTNDHHWPRRICQAIDGQQIFGRDLIAEFIAGVGPKAVLALIAELRAALAARDEAREMERKLCERIDAADKLRVELATALNTTGTALTAARTALQKYGAHTVGCGLSAFGGKERTPECTCGLDKALASEGRAKE